MFDLESIIEKYVIKIDLTFKQPNFSTGKITIIKF